MSESAQESRGAGKPDHVFFGRELLRGPRSNRLKHGYRAAEEVWVALKRLENPDPHNARFDTHYMILAMYQDILRSHGRFPALPDLVDLGVNRGKEANSDTGIARIIDKTLKLPRVNGTKLRNFRLKVAKLTQDANFLKHLAILLGEFPSVYTPFALRPPDFVCHAIYDYLRGTHRPNCKRYITLPLIAALPDYARFRAWRRVRRWRSLPRRQRAVNLRRYRKWRRSPAGADSKFHKKFVGELQELCDFTYTDSDNSVGWELSTKAIEWRKANPRVSITSTSLPWLRS